MKKYSANYSHTHHNFVIQNLHGKRIKNKYLPALCIVKNILQRGKPTLLSDYLQQELGDVQRLPDFNMPQPFLATVTPTWTRRIKGSDSNNFYPAKTFFDNLSTYIPEYPFLQQLLIPEMAVNEITMIPVDEFENQQVDFYLPQAFLIIEIDGSQHLEPAQVALDKARDKHTSKHKIETVRITVKDLQAKNARFYRKIKKIKDRIEAVDKEWKIKDLAQPVYSRLTDYQKAYANGYDSNNPLNIATAIMRFQLLLVALLENGHLQFNQEWKLAVLFRDVQSRALDLAINDLLLWFDAIFQLQKIDTKQPKITIHQVTDATALATAKEAIKIDFSLCQRYTDEPEEHPNILYVRTDYLDVYRVYRIRKGFEYKAYDYFQISTTAPVNYSLQLDKGGRDRQKLLFLVWNLFLQKTEGLTMETLRFREGQLPIIANILARKDTIGLLPTGSGKSVCYQLAAILQPAISFVVCPIKSLMYDQKADLDALSFTRTNFITGDSNGEEKEVIQSEFGAGKYFFVFISPERFQIKKFRQYFTKVNNDYTIAYAIIDEVHCLSEWGHSFRTSYLNLSNTINRLCPNSKYLGLTATASVNVLKDIQLEFKISPENVKTPIKYTREELDFIILDDKHAKLSVIKSELEVLKSEIGALQLQSENTKCGVIFTPFVNGSKGCYWLAQNLKQHFNTAVKYYTGSIPKIAAKPIMGQKKYNNHKKRVQQDFKNNKFSLLTATKAFGMGINKGNIHYTFHYGMPGSMEAFYQEAGRAGRDKTKFIKEKAKCYVLLSKAVPDAKLQEVWDRNTSLSRLKKIQRSIKGDVNSHLFLFTNGLDEIEHELQYIRFLHTTFSKPNGSEILVSGAGLNVKKARVEKGIYRLYQLGIVKDWTIRNFYGNGEFEVSYNDYNEESIRDALIDNIRKYDKEFSLEAVINGEDERYTPYRDILVADNEVLSNTDKYIKLLLQWSYDNFAYNRRQSLKNIYENCCAYTDGLISPAEFKTRLENYFKFTQTTYVLQDIAENPDVSAQWFRIFYDPSGGLINNAKQQALRDNLSRLLESYRNNTVLDLISGLVRLLLQDYENLDGRLRLEGALMVLKKSSPTHRDSILAGVFKIGAQLDVAQRKILATSLYKTSPTYENVLNIYKHFGDEYWLKILLSLANERLTQINSKLNGPLKKIGDA